LNRYSVGRQIASVARKSSGSLIAEESAWAALCEAPMTAPYRNRLNAEL
jgi:hypothetical protein